MARKKPSDIDPGIKKLQRRIQDLDALDIADAYINGTFADETLIGKIRESIREVFGPASPEFREHERLRLWAGAMEIGMSQDEVIQGMERGRAHIRGILRGLIERLQEVKEDLEEKRHPPPKPVAPPARVAAPAPASVASSPAPRVGASPAASVGASPALHPRIAEVAGDLVSEGRHWEAVFGAAKALVNYVREKSGRHDLDGAELMRTAFARVDPILSVNALTSPEDAEEQEGIMNLMEGAVLAVRSPGGNASSQGGAPRALEYLALLSLLAYRVQAAQRRKSAS